MCNKNGRRRKERKQYVYFLDHRQIARVSTHFVSASHSLSLFLYLALTHILSVSPLLLFPSLARIVSGCVQRLADLLHALLSGTRYATGFLKRHLFFLAHFWETLAKQETCIILVGNPVISVDRHYTRTRTRQLPFSCSRWVWSGFSSNRVYFPT